jgi:predicted transcriptional regulator
MGQFPTSFRLSEEDIEILSWLADKRGNSRTAILKRMLREEKRREERKDAEES